MELFNFSEKNFGKISDSIEDINQPGPAAGSSAALTSVLGISSIVLSFRVQVERMNGENHKILKKSTGDFNCYFFDRFGINFRHSVN